MQKNADLKKIINFIVRLILSPFNENLWFFFCLVIFLSFYDIVGWISMHKSIHAIDILCLNVLIAYIIALPAGICPKSIITKIYRIIILFFASISILIDFICWRLIGAQFTDDFPEILKATNPSEFLELSCAVFNIWRVIEFTVVIVLTIVIARLLKTKTSANTTRSYILLIFTFFSAIYGCSHFMPEQDFALGRAYIWYKSSRKMIPDLKKYPSDLKITANEKSQPQKLVIILGESYSKLHSSLYDYGKTTCPKLQSLRDKGNLIIFDEVESADVYTLGAINSIMTDCFSNPGKDWYESNKLIELIGKDGYHVRWISNQSPVGIYDHPQYAYSLLADEHMFMGNKFDGNEKMDSDSLLLAPIDTMAISKKHKYDAFIIHMMGSHELFENRYPHDFKHFTESDYPDAPKHQRKVLADYDNSILFNDHIVYEIIDRFKDEDALIFYFSDHGEDVFFSDPSRYGHGRKGDSESISYAKKIPFMVYLTDKYQQLRPEKKEEIQKLATKPFNTKDFMYFLFDILDTKIEQPQNSK